MFEKLLAALKKLGFVTEENEADVVETIKPLIAEPDPKPPATSLDTAGLDPATKQVVDALQAQVAALTQGNKDLLAALAKEREDREKAIKAQNDQAAAEKKAAAKKAVDDAIEKGLFPEAKRESMQAIADGNLDNFKALIADMKPDPLFKEKDGDGGGKDKNDGSLKSPLQGVNQTVLDAVKKYSD